MPPGSSAACGHPSPRSFERDNRRRQRARNQWAVGKEMLARRRLCVLRKLANYTTEVVLEFHRIFIEPTAACSPRKRRRRARMASFGLRRTLYLTRHSTEWKMATLPPLSGGEPQEQAKEQGADGGSVSQHELCAACVLAPIDQFISPLSLSLGPGRNHPVSARACVTPGCLLVSMRVACGSRHVLVRHAQQANVPQRARASKPVASSPMREASFSKACFGAPSFL